MSAVKKIDSFRGQYFFLSNFFPAPVIYGGLTYQNNEAAFQAQKIRIRTGELPLLHLLLQMPREGDGMFSSERTGNR